MFKKLVSNMPFSPGLVNQVGFYVKRLRKEEFIRRAGMIFTALSIAVQTLTLLMPPTHAAPGSLNNMVFEAITDKDHLERVFKFGDSNGNKDIDDIFEHFGITLADIEAAEETTMRSSDLIDGFEAWTLGRKPFGKPDEEKVTINTDEGTSSDLWLRPWARSWGTYTTEVIKGTTSQGQEFAVIMNCGNLVIAYPKEPPQPYDSFMRVNCENIGGWVYDPRRETATIKVKIFIDNEQVAVVEANEENYSGARYYKEGVAGDHGFFYNYSDSYKDGEDHQVVVTIVESEADVAARGGITGEEDGSSMIVKGSQDVIGAECYTPPPEEPPKEFDRCDIRTGQVVSVPEDELDDPNYVDPSECALVDVCRPGVGVLKQIPKYDVKPGDLDESECDPVQVCIDDEIIEIPKYRRTDEPPTCPIDEVCDLESGAIVSITTDIIKKNPDRYSDDESLCDEIQVCDLENGGLIFVELVDWNPELNPVPTLDDLGNYVCDDPESERADKKNAANLTQDIDDANGTRANPDDVIEYKLITANVGNLDGEFPIVEDIEDILEYADLTDNGGAVLDEDTKKLDWGVVTVPAGESVVHSFTIKVKNVLPETAQSEANPASFDFIMTNVYGNTVEIELPKPISKEVEEFASSLPETGPAENGLFIGLFVVLVTFFYYRNRLVTKELIMIRKEFNGA